MAFKEKLVAAIAHPVQTFRAARSRAKLEAAVDRDFRKELTKDMGMKVPSEKYPLGLTPDNLTFLAWRALKSEGLM